LSSPLPSPPSSRPAVGDGTPTATSAASDARTPDGPRSALTHLGSHLRFWGVAAAGLALDLWSKDWAFRTLGQGGRRVLVPHVLELQTMMNDGALFGIGSGQTTLFLVASVLALGLVLWMFASSSPRSWLLQVAFGSILAGAAGNMSDRLFVRLVGLPGPGGALRYFQKDVSADGQRILLREYPGPPHNLVLERPGAEAARLPKEVGHVRDFIKIPTRVFGKRELWPWVFNVADTLLVGGVGVLALRLWLDRRSSARGRSSLDSLPAKA